MRMTMGLMSAALMLSHANAQEVEVALVADNPDPGNLPTLGLWYWEGRPQVSATFPNVPGFTCDSWCYESNTTLLDAKAVDGGRLQLRHGVNDHPGVTLVTTVTPEPGAVEFLARFEIDEDAGDLPGYLITPNMCWQLRRAEGFMSPPDPYPDFVKRCFIFTRDGLTFLDRTDRKPIPVRPADDPCNNPPWVQMYVGEWQAAPTPRADEWAGWSDARYITNIIGAVSRDRRWLAALACADSWNMCQAWHDCMHANPSWEPVTGPHEERKWRVKVYAMANDPVALLERVARDFPGARHAYQTPGVEHDLPAHIDALKSRLTFPMSWLSGNDNDFDRWRKQTRAKVMECLLPPPAAVDFAPVVIAEEDRGSYVARKVTLNISGDARVLAYITVPRGDGPFPAVLTLHDHGARFDIGKEKVIRPFDDSEQRIASAQEWVDTCYGGRWLGDELARRGYVCFSHDALNWSDRGGAGYDGQQALAGNLFHLGTSLAGTIAHEDIRAAEFLATRPEVDPSRVAAMGLSMGCFRAWQVSALSDHIAAGVAICWMGTVKGLMVPNQNQTRGQSCFTMLHPGLFNYLDYPDFASLACPKPMLFYNGLQDALFPVDSVNEAYAKMRAVWESQGVGDRLETRLWDVPHEFNTKMQDAAFAWLDAQMGR